MNTIRAKTILTHVSDHTWFGMDYRMNLYRGCSHGCIYCDSRSDCYQIENFNSVRVKENAIEILQNELSRRIKRGVIGTGAMSDPYNPLEEKLMLTGQALKLADQYHFGIGIATKSKLIARDTELLKDIQKHSPVICKITITTYDDSLCRIIEPKVSPSSERFQALTKLTDAGIYAGILMMPLLPYLTDTINNVKSIIQTAHECGARFIYPAFGLTLRNGQREYLYHSFDHAFPDLNLKEIYRSLYGSTYECHSPKVEELYELFTKECNRLGILYRMEDIILDFRKPYSYDQYQLF